MHKLSIGTLALIVAIFLGSCSSNPSDFQNDQLDSNQIDVNELRARKSATSSKEEEKLQQLDLSQHAAITSHTEIVESKLQTLLASNKEEAIRLNILDVNGKLLSSKLTDAQTGVNSYLFDFSQLEVGLYYVVMISNDVYRRFCVAKTN